MLGLPHMPSCPSPAPHSAPPRLQVGWRYLGPAKLEVDLYRAQRRFPHEPFRLLVILARSMLSSSMMLVYPVQTGHMHVALCRCA